MNFIKKIFLGRSDEAVHRQFIRFGKGTYGRRGLLNIWKTNKIKIKSSFEFANDFTMFVAELGNFSFNGDIYSKDKLEGLDGVKKRGKWVYESKNFTSSQIKELKDRAYCFLLNADGDGIKLRIKSKLPKPGKSENKIDDKFCRLELDEKYYKKVKEDFFWDLPECKKTSVNHTFIIDGITLPKGETDYEKIRELGKRKGKIIRIANVDGKEIKTEKDFEE